MSTTQSLLERERHYLGTGMTPGFLNAPMVFERGEGAYLFDVEGRRYIDFCAGTFTNATGHCHPQVIEFMRQRVGELWNIHDYATPYRAPLLECLDEITPPGVDHFCFYSGGTETIEAGLRALRSFLPAGRHRFMAFAGGYHGKTLGSRQVFHWGFPGEPGSEHVLVPFPDGWDADGDPLGAEERSLAAMEQALERDASIGAFVFEPIQGAAGNLCGSPEFWRRAQTLLRQHEVVLFADEICVGFGRTGSDLACQRLGIQPDLVAFAKGIASGFPAMVLAGHGDIMKAAPFGAPGGASTTFGGNPLAVAAMYITTKVYREEKLACRAALAEQSLRERLAALAARFPVIKAFRCQGLMATLHFDVQGSREPSVAFSLRVHARCMALGLKVMTFDQLFRIAPPLNITDQALVEGLSVLTRAIEAESARL